MYRKISRIAFYFKLSLALLGIVLVGGTAFLTMILSFELDCSNPSKYLTIQSGANVEDVANQLVAEKCIPRPAVLKLAMRLTFKDKLIKAGRYTLKGITTMNQLIQMITSPNADRIKVTILEGWTIKQITETLTDELDIDAFRFQNLCYDHNFIHSLGISAPSLEGFLFPDTYIFLSTYAEENIIQIMVNQFKHNFQTFVSPYTNRARLNQLELATLASIIQGEAMYKDEMQKISSVYHNRIEKKMKLQADPTIQYILPKRKKRLYTKDLRIDSPYNTYKYYGLPPGPINNPGLAALKAAANPDQTEYLYFVADGKGRHIFSRTNREHNQARFQLKRRRR